MPPGSLPPTASIVWTGQLPTPALIVIILSYYACSSPELEAACCSDLQVKKGMDRPMNRVPSIPLNTIIIMIPVSGITHFVLAIDINRVHDSRCRQLGRLTVESIITPVLERLAFQAFSHLSQLLNWVRRRFANAGLPW
jgi:hypothetical protein